MRTSATIVCAWSLQIAARSRALGYTRRIVSLCSYACEAKHYLSKNCESLLTTSASLLSSSRTAASYAPGIRDSILSVLECLIASERARAPASDHKPNAAVNLSSPRPLFELELQMPKWSEWARPTRDPNPELESARQKAVPAVNGTYLYRGFTSRPTNEQKDSH